MILIFLGIFVVSDIYLEELYLFEWTKRNRYWGMWLLWKNKIKTGGYRFLLL